MGFILDGSELRIFDSVTSDQTAAAGDDVNYYSLNKQASTVDPLYGEYITRQMDGPWRISASVTWAKRTPMPSETGYTVEFDGECKIARVHLDEKSAPYPTEDDIIEMFRTPYHDADSLGRGLFFDVIKADSDGYINDSPNFTKFVLTLKRRPQFGAERKVNLP